MKWVLNKSITDDANWLHIVNAGYLGRAIPRLLGFIVSHAAKLRAIEQGEIEVLEVSCCFTGSCRMRELNRKYRNIDKETNVLAFPLGDAHHAYPNRAYLGDVILCYDVIAREAGLAGIAIEHHTLHMILHGVLHLLGYDHIKDSDARVMEGLERKILMEFAIDLALESDDRNTHKAT